MILDSEQQRGMLLQMLSAMKFEGKDIDAIYHLKFSIENAQLETDRIAASKHEQQGQGPYG